MVYTKNMKKLIVGALAVVLLVGGLTVAINKKHPPKLETRNKQLYVALGDSVAAGLGLKDYTDPSACNRTHQAYPQLVAAKHSYQLVNLACSGAKSDAGILSTQTVNEAGVKPQLSQLFALPKPKLITMTIGANDMGWTDILTKCYVSACGDYADTALVDKNLDNLQTNLVQIFTQMAQHYPSQKPLVIVTGYYQLLPASLQQCPEMSGLDDVELAWERNQQTKLNDMIKTSAANFNFVSYVSAGFDGHELCTDESWVQNISASAPFHPNVAGQMQYARDIK